MPESETQHQSELNVRDTPLALGRADLLAIALLVAGLVGVFWKVLFTPAMFYFRDVYNYTFPSARLIHDLCRQGFLPFWNPYLNYGQPLLANPNLLFFYPFTLLIILLPINVAFTLHFLAHFAWAGIGVYLLARAWRQSRVGAFFAAFVFTFSGPVLSLGNLYNLSACAAWIPWALLATDRALASPGVRRWALLVLVFSLQWLGAEPLTMLATFALCFAYAFHRCGDAGKLWSKANGRLLATFLLVGMGILMVCAVQLLPASSVLSQSRRGVQGLSFGETTTWSLNPFSLPEMLIPDFFGSGIGATSGWPSLMTDPNLGPHYLSVFVGFIPLFCALAGWALTGDRRRNFVAGAAGVFLLLSFGRFTPVFALAYLLFPPLAVVRYPVKLLLVVTFLAAILAGWGIDALRSPASQWNARSSRLLLPLNAALACIVATLGVAWIYPPLILSPTRWALEGVGETPFNLHQMPDFLITMLRYQLPGLAGFCLGGIVLAYGLKQQKPWARPGLYAFALLAVAQLVWVNSGANPTVPKSFYAYRPPVLKEFREPPGTYRVASFWPTGPTTSTPELQTYISFDSIPEAATFGADAQGALQSRLQLATGAMLNQVEGNINLDLERSLPPYVYDVEIYQDQHSADPLHVDCLLGRTNVKYIIRPTPADSAATHAIGEVFNGSPLPSRLYEDSCFAPRGYVAGNALFSLNAGETLDRLASPDFDAHNTVILAAGAGTSPAVTGAGSAGQVEIVRRTPNSVTLRAQLARPGYVVLLDRYDPNWQASIDGRPAPVVRANQLFRAVYAAAGQHEIRFLYRQRGLALGIVISLLSLALLAVLYFQR